MSDATANVAVTPVLPLLLVRDAGARVVGGATVSPGNVGVDVDGVGAAGAMVVGGVAVVGGSV
jgi:hypothetical protein